MTCERAASVIDRLMESSVKRAEYAAIGKSVLRYRKQLRRRLVADMKREIGRHFGAEAFNRVNITPWLP